MLKIIAVTATCLVVMGTLLSQSSQSIAPTFAQPDSAAQHALASFKRGFSPSYYGITRNDLQRCQLDTPFVNYYVSLDALASYTPAQHPKVLLGSSHGQTYPITLDGRIIAELDVIEQNGKWKEFRSGGDGSSTRKMLNAFAKIPAGSDQKRMLIEVATIDSTYFVGWTTDADLMLIPIFDDASRALRSAVPLSGRQLFTELHAHGRKNKAQIEKDHAQ